MGFAIVTYAFAVLGLVGIVAVLGGRLDRVGRSPDQVEACGPFELVTQDTGNWSTHVIRYRGEDYTFPGRSGPGGEAPARYSRPNALVSFASATPAFLAHVGDPNNTGAYYLIHEVDGAPRADFLTESRGGVSVDWADDPAGGRGIRDIAVHRKRLEGGQYLLVDDTCVVDVATLTPYRFTLPSGCSLIPFKGSLGLSPRRTSFVRLASGSENRPCLVATCFLDGTSQVLPIDRRTMRYEQNEDIDAAWVAHHFTWRTEEGGPDRLHPREDFAPLPYRGRLTVNSDGYREYRLPASSPALLDTLVAFVRRELVIAEGAPEDAADGVADGVAVSAAEDAAGSAAEGAAGSAAEDTATESAAGGEEPIGGGPLTLRIGNGEVVFAYYDDHATAYSTREGSSRPVLAVARGFDELLATGRYDALFTRTESNTP